MVAGRLDDGLLAARAVQCCGKASLTSHLEHCFVHSVFLILRSAWLVHSCRWSNHIGWWFLHHDRGVMHHDRGFLHHDRGFMHHDRGFMYHDRGFMHHDRGFMHHDRGFMHHDRWRFMNIWHKTTSTSRGSAAHVLHHLGHGLHAMHHTRYADLVQRETVIEEALHDAHVCVPALNAVQTLLPRGVTNRLQHAPGDEVAGTPIGPHGREVRAVGALCVQLERIALKASADSCCLALRPGAGPAAHRVILVVATVPLQHHGILTRVIVVDSRLLAVFVLRGGGRNVSHTGLAGVQAAAPRGGSGGGAALLDGGDGVRDIGSHEVGDAGTH